ncbi:MAG: hypothetical protein MZV65_47500 [Chromatiales bacterium]|nr:hypothetical protein [Chromatiales bacterium]
MIKGGKAEQSQQIRAARITSAIVGITGVAIAFAAEKQNVAHLVALGFRRVSGWCLTGGGAFTVLEENDHSRDRCCIAGRHSQRH